MKNKPLRIVEGSADPHARFWRWVPRAADDDPAELQFYGYISEYSWLGDEITPAKFRADLQQYGAGGPITVRIHSGGGDLLAASAIRAMLSDYPGRKTVRIDGLCASAAVAVALAGDEILIQDSAYMMIHNPGYSALLGWMDAADLRELAEHLDKFAESITDIYVRRTRMSREIVTAMMDMETWMTAEESVDFGFADRVVDGEGMAAPPANPSVANLVQQCTHPPDGLLSPPRLSAEAAALRNRVNNILKGATND